MKPQQMSPLERRASYSLASIYSLRMMGLFMILPVFSLYAEELVHTTPVLIGLAIGAYGLTCFRSLLVCYLTALAVNR